MKKRLLIAGGTGLIGSAVRREAMQLGWDVTILSRKEGSGHILWDPHQGMIRITEPHTYDAIINLAGASIAGRRWTTKRLQLIMDSRINAAKTLEKYLISGLLQTGAYLGVSAIGIYGDQGEKEVDESTDILPSDDWLVRIALMWEDVHKAISALGIRTIIVRIGIVLSMEGGVLPEILQTAPFGFLAYFGQGRQTWSWIHLDDVVRVMLWGLQQEQAKGLYLAVSPNPVSNRDLILEINRLYILRRITLGIPEFVLQLMLGKMHNVLLQSLKGFPTRLLREGFEFEYPTISKAMMHLVKKEKSSG